MQAKDHHSASPNGDNGDNTGYFHTEGNEAMKPIPLVFNSFHRTRICQFTFNPIQDMRRGDVQKGPQLVSLKTF